MSEIRLSDEQRQALIGAIKEGVGSMYRKQAEVDLLKEIAERMKEQYDIPPKMYRKLVTTAYKDNAKKINDEVTELLDLAEELGLYSHSEE